MSGLSSLNGYQNGPPCNTGASSLSRNRIDAATSKSDHNRTDVIDSDSKNGPILPRQTTVKQESN